MLHAWRTAAQTSQFFAARVAAAQVFAELSPALACGPLRTAEHGVADPCLLALPGADAAVVGGNAGAAVVRPQPSAHVFTQSASLRAPSEARSAERGAKR